MTPTVDQIIETPDTELKWSGLYEKAIEILAKADADHTFESVTCEQSAVIIKNIIRFSKKSVFIYVNELSIEVSGRIPGLLNVIRDFLEIPESQLYIAVNGSQTEKRSIDEIGILKLCQLYPDKFRIKIASESFKNSFQEIKEELSIEQEIYFAVGDMKSFQIMTVGEQYKGYGSFNNKNVSEKLYKTFMENFQKCNENYFSQEELSPEVVYAIAA